MTQRDEEQDDRLERLEQADREQAEEDERQRAAAARERAEAQAQQEARDKEQERQLQEVEHDTQFIETELPGIDTKVGGEQRLKLKVPTPLTIVTLGSIGNRDVEGNALGPAGFALHTIENLAAEVHKSTIIDTDLHTIFHSGKTWTGVAGDEINLSTNGDYQLGTVGGVAISAAGGAGFTDPAFTVDPQMAVPDAPAIDTGGPRKSTEGKKAAWGAVWKAWDTYSGAMSLAKVKEDGLSKGIGKDTFGAKTAGLYSILNNLKKVGTGLWAGYTGAVAAFDHSAPAEKASGPGKPKVTVYADDGVSITSPEKISLFSSWGGISVECPHKVGVKAGVSASMKAGCDATVFAFVSAKLESKAVAAVKGKVVTIAGELTEVTAKTGLVLNSKGTLGIEAEGPLRVSSKTKLGVSAAEVMIGSDSDIGLECDDVIVVHAKNQSNLWGDDKVYIKSGKEIEAMVSKSGMLVTDGNVKVGVDKNGMEATTSKVAVGTSGAFAKFTSSAFTIKASGASKIKASNISLC